MSTNAIRTKRMRSAGQIAGLTMHRFLIWPAPGLEGIAMT